MTTDRLTPAELDDLERLHREAFRAPWVSRTFEIECPCPNGEDCGDSHTCEEVEAPEEYPADSEHPAEPGHGQCVVQIDVPGLEQFARSNGQLIAAARNALPRLIAAAREAERLREALRLADAAMNHMGDVLNELGAEEPENDAGEGATSRAFAAVRAALAGKEGE